MNINYRIVLNEGNASEDYRAAVILSFRGVWLEITMRVITNKMVGNM